MSAAFLPDPADLRWLVRCLALGSFSAAAREQDVAVSVATRAVDRLEAGYGVSLIRRSTHGLTATPEGEFLAAEARDWLARLADVGGQLGAQAQGVAGTVRLATSMEIGLELLVPQLPRLREAHPALRVELVADDRVADLVTGGIDVALRSTVGPSEAVVARALGRFERRLYASPRYLAERGTPRTPADLAAHAAITHTAQGASPSWPFRVDGEAVEVPVRSALAANTSSLVRRAVVEGLGIGLLSAPMAAAAVARGELVEVLAGHASGHAYGLHAVWLPARHHSARVRAVVDFLARCAREAWQLELVSIDGMKGGRDPAAPA